MCSRLWFPRTRRHELRWAPAVVTAEFFPTFCNHAIRLSFPAVNRSRSIGTPGVFGVWPDRFDHQVEFTGAVDLARYAVRHVRRDELGFGEVMQAINAVSGMVEHHEDRARAVFRPREQREVIGAEVEHG